MTRRTGPLRLDRRFQQLRVGAFEHFAAGDYEKVLPAALAAEGEYPEKGEVPFWIACVYGATGRPRAALEALRTGLARGLYWPDDWLLEDDDLAPVRADTGFAAVVAESARLRTLTEKAATPPAAVTLPAWTGGTRAATSTSPRAIAVTLHGWGQTAEEHAAEWIGVAAAGVAVVAPESAQEPTPGFFVWDDRAAARAAVAAQVRRALGRLHAGEAPLVLAGFSQGGGLAIDLALDGDPLQAAAGLALSSGAEDLEAPPTTPRLRAATGRGLRIRLVAGERDAALPGARGLAAALAGAGIDCPLLVVPGAGHEMPSPESGLLLGEVEALLA